MAGARGESGRPGQEVARWARGHLALWISAAAKVAAALVVLVTVLIALPGQSDGNISGLVQPRRSP